MTEIILEASLRLRHWHVLSSYNKETSWFLCHLHAHILSTYALLLSPLVCSPNRFEANSRMKLESFLIFCSPGIEAKGCWPNRFKVTLPLKMEDLRDSFQKWGYRPLSDDFFMVNSIVVECYLPCSIRRQLWQCPTSGCVESDCLKDLTTSWISDVRNHQMGFPSYVYITCMSPFTPFCVLDTSPSQAWRSQQVQIFAIHSR